DGGLAGCVEEGGEGGEGEHAGDMGVHVVGVGGEASEGRRGAGQGRGEEDVHALEEGAHAAGQAGLQPVGGQELRRRQGAAALRRGPDGRLEVSCLRGGGERGGELRETRGGLGADLRAIDAARRQQVFLVEGGRRLLHMVAEGVQQLRRAGHGRDRGG